MTTETIRFPVTGMTCTSCVNAITRSLRRVPGIESVRVNLADEVATVRRDPDIARDALIEEAVASAGYEAQLDARLVVPDEPARPGVRGFLDRLRG